MTTDELTEGLSEALDIIYEISTAQEELLAAQEELKGLDEKAKAMAQGILYHIRGTLFLALGIIIGVCIDMIISRILYWVLKLPSNDVIAAILLVVCVLVGYALLLMEPHKAKAQAFREEREATLKKIINGSIQEIQYVANSPSFQRMKELIPADYATLDAATFFLTAVKNRRADTLKEAINLYEHEKHNRAMLDLQQQEIDLLHQSVELEQEQLNAQQKILKTETTIANRQEALLHKTKKISKQVRFSNAVGIINTVRHWNN